MKPMTGLIRNRAKAGMTIPAAPRITSASLKPGSLEIRCAILPLCRLPAPLSAMMAAGKSISCIVGGGPAGMVAGLLFARAGVPTIVLEKHGDFLRDFRGDTVHPSTLRDLLTSSACSTAPRAAARQGARASAASSAARRLAIADFAHSIRAGISSR